MLIIGLFAVEFDIFISSASIAKVSPSVPIDSIAGCAEAVTVPAEVAVPVKSPVKVVDVKLPSCGLYVSPVSDSNP